MTAAALMHHSLPAELLASGLSQMALALDQSTQEKLLQYVALLDKWNKVYNLTAVRDPQRMIGMHILDSLSILSIVAKHKHLLDVGSGGGLPGIPLAIVLATIAPEFHVTMLDTITKKTTFIRQAIGELGLTNAIVVTERVENYRPESVFDAVVSRAFSELKDFVDGAGHLCAPDGRLLAMKGVHPYDEIARLSVGYTVEAVTPLQVPQVDGQRHLVVIKKN
ncbi:MAG: 16S rRNA (guanine(527)-N(7))-methyltransferase RsmG [Betaproteobacteria bacterium]